MIIAEKRNLPSKNNAFYSKKHLMNQTNINEHQIMTNNLFFDYYNQLFIWNRILSAFIWNRINDASILDRLYVSAFE